MFKAILKIIRGLFIVSGTTFFILLCVAIFLGIFDPISSVNVRSNERQAENKVAKASEPINCIPKIIITIGKVVPERSMGFEIGWIFGNWFIFDYCDGSDEKNIKEKALQEIEEVTENLSDETMAFFRRDSKHIIVNLPNGFDPEKIKMTKFTDVLKEYLSNEEKITSVLATKIENHAKHLK
jgi:hypothetical protein